MLIKSMTGFGRSERISEEYKIVVEMKAVNHRYCDLNIKLPRRLNCFESAIRKLLKDYMERGKVDLFITYEDYSKAGVCVKYNREVAAQYISYLNDMAREHDLPQGLSVVAVGRYPEVFSLEEQVVDDAEIWSVLKEVICEAAEAFVQSRIEEGKNLQADLLAKLDEMTGMVDFIESRAPEILAAYKEKLLERVRELSENVQIDEQRIAMEVTLFADKICVDEEIVRLKSHIASAKNIMLAGGAVGRKLDFIAQEMNREANTILSKSNSLQISDTGIGLKTTIEKVREQIQNME